MKKIEADEIEQLFERELINYRHFKPYYDEYGWLVVFPGEEDGRRPPDKIAKAITFVHLALSTKEDIVRCLKDLDFSNQNLITHRPRLDFDRRRIRLSNNQIRFSIAWYDIEFFQEKKDSWKNNTHHSIFKSFNVRLEDFIVEHIIL